jgi:hypothetical protein
MEQEYWRILTQELSTNRSLFAEDLGDVSCSMEASQRDHFVNNAFGNYANFSIK